MIQYFSNMNFLLEKLTNNENLMTLTLFNIYFNSLIDKPISSAAFYVQSSVSHFLLFLFINGDAHFLLQCAHPYLMVLY